MILLTTLGGTDVYINAHRIYAIQDKTNHSIVFAGNERFPVSETAEMILRLIELSRNNG